MVNHIRTLLLNKASVGSATGYAGEEYVPFAFKAVELPTDLKKIRALLFGTDPDRYMLNFRLRQYLPLLHQARLSEFVESRDDRVSYELFDDDYFSSLFGITVTKADLFTGDLISVGRFAADENTGKMFYNWTITVTDANTVNVQTSSPTLTNNNYAYTLTNNRSDQIPFDHSTLKFMFTGPVGAKWYVDGLARPSRTLADIWKTLRDGLTTILEISLFGAAPAGDYLIWSNIWNKHSYPEYKIGAVLLALAARTEEASSNT